MGAWQEGSGAQDTGGSSGLARGTAGYMRLRKESLVCRFTWQEEHKVMYQQEHSAKRKNNIYFKSDERSRKKCERQKVVQLKKGSNSV